MKCENNFCIYWNSDRCLLYEISLDVTGHCLECIYVELIENDLEKHRKRMRTDYLHSETNSP